MSKQDSGKVVPDRSLMADRDWSLEIIVIIAVLLLVSGFAFPVLVALGVLK